jgi:hypothetical protein
LGRLTERALSRVAPPDDRIAKREASERRDDRVAGSACSAVILRE